jgi:Na+/H+ antiporter NhaC
MNENSRLRFRLGPVGRLVPLVAAIVFIIIAAVRQSNVSGYVIAFFAALILGVPFAKNSKDYGEAVVAGLVRPIFPVISVAIILASVAGQLVSSSGLIQTLASAVISLHVSGGVFTAFSFFICCVLSMSTGTSVGTIMVSFPLLFPVGVLVGGGPAYMAGALVAGGFFGDNLAPISDTTIASAGTQKADMGGVVATRVWYSVPAAVLAFFTFLIFGGRGGTVTSATGGGLTSNPWSLVMLVVPVVIILLCFFKQHLISALSWGVIAGIAAGLIFRVYKVSDIFNFPGGFKVSGMFITSITGSAGTLFMLYGVFGLLGVLDKSGLIEDFGKVMTKLAGSAAKPHKTRSEFVILIGIGVVSCVTGVISVAIVALGDIVADIGGKAGINRYRRANLMDCGGIATSGLVPWNVHAVLPAQLVTQAVAGMTLTPVAIFTHNFYSIWLLLLLVVAIITGFRRNHLPKVAAAE